jgi:hypothetical protein
MREECDFATEHADGSFMEHLQFCYEYATIHFRQHSARVAFLHSILGVGTNLFPMAAAKMPQLRAMLSDFEWLHVQSFPSVLRLIFSGEFLRELIAMAGEEDETTTTSAKEVNATDKNEENEKKNSDATNQSKRTKLDRISEVTFYRVLDNEPLRLAADDLWIQLNFQMMHLLDFIPVSNWTAQSNDIYLQNFVLLHGFLRRAGRLQCTLDFNISSSTCEVDGVNPPHPNSVAIDGDSDDCAAASCSRNEGLPMTLDAVLGRMIPCSVSKYMSERAIRR